MGILTKSFRTSYYQAKYFVDEDQHGMRLDQFIQIYMESFSREEVKRKIKDGDVVIKDRPGKHRPNTKLHHRDIVTLTLKKTTQEDEWWNGSLLNLQLKPDIVFEDDHLIVISKPAYMAAHPTGKHLFNCATVYFEEKYEKTIHSIHRLDRETSGVMMLAKDPKTAHLMTDQFDKDLVSKCYMFVSKKNEDYAQSEFVEEARLGTNETGLKRVYINHFDKNSTEGKHAKTTFKVLFEEGKYAIGLAFPKTGRQHQIRVHAMINGLPLVGDKLYLGNFKMFQRFKDNIASEEDHELMEISRHALHAMALKACYQGQDKVFKTSIPNDLGQLIQSKFSNSIDEIEKELFLEIDNYFTKELR